MANSIYNKNKMLKSGYEHYEPGTFAKIVMAVTLPAMAVALISVFVALIVVPDAIIVTLIAFLVAVIGSILLVVDIVRFNRKQKKKTAGRSVSGSKKNGASEQKVVDMARLGHLIAGIILGILIGYLIWGWGMQ